MSASKHFMLRPSARLGLTLLLAVAFATPWQRSLAQTPVAPSPQASAHKTASTTTTPAHKSKAHAKKTVPPAEVPQAPPPPPTLEQQPPAAPQVTYQNGQLAIDSQNATLSQVLRSVQTQTGAVVDMPSGAGNERVVAKLGPGTPKDVLASLLNGSKFNYVILGDPNNSGRVQKVILLTKSSASGGTPATTAQNNFQPPAPQQAVEPNDDEYQQNEPEPEVQVMPGQAGMNGSEQVPPEGGTSVPVPPPGGRTPEQMLQELQRMQQQQQQYQQQLNPSNQQPIPNQPQGAPQ